MLFSWQGIWLGGPGKKTLQCPRFDSGVAQLQRGPRSGRETLHFVALGFDRAAHNSEGHGLAGSGKALNTLNAVGRAEHVLNNAFLGPIELRMPVGNLNGLGTGCHGRKMVLALSDAANDLLFGLNGPGRGELAARNVVPLDSLELTRGKPCA